MSITIPLPADVQTRRFAGPGGKLPKGFVNTSDPNYAGAGVVLVKADGETPLVVASNADAVSNTQDQVPTSARLQTFNGTTWDRARGDTANGLDVDVTRLPYTPAVAMSHTTATATTTSGAMLASNANRKYALLQNIGTVDVYIKIGSAASASQGICLLANGGGYEMSAAYGNLATGAINGITASSSAAVIVTEGA